MIYWQALAALLFSIVRVPAEAYVISGFGPSSYTADTVAMDTALRVSGYVIEDFEDADLVPRLSVEYTHTGLGPMTSLPGLLDSDPVFFRRDFPGHAWDGSHIMYTVQPADTVSALVVRVSGGARSFGIALSDYHPDTQLWAINGQVVGTVGQIANFFATDTGRNGYLRLDISPGDAPIESVTFFHAAFGESLEYDHIAFLPEPIPEPIPEPEIAAVIASGFLILLFYGRRISWREYEEDHGGGFAHQYFGRVWSCCSDRSNWQSHRQRKFRNG